MQRVMIVYQNGKTTYGMFEDDKDNPCFWFSGSRYGVKDIVDTGVQIKTNNDALYNRFSELGIPVSRTEKQYTITISVQEDTKTRLQNAAKATGRSVSNILEEQGRIWLKKNGY